MANTLIELEQKAAQLPPEERAQLALYLMRSLEPSEEGDIEEGDIEEAWRIEAEARWAQIQRGEAKTVPGPEVFADVRHFLR
jgi:putative addiction module component (TIGR02574 family)